MSSSWENWKKWHAKNCHQYKTTAATTPRLPYINNCESRILLLIYTKQKSSELVPVLRLNPGNTQLLHLRFFHFFHVRSPPSQFPRPRKTGAVSSLGDFPRLFSRGPTSWRPVNERQLVDRVDHCGFTAVSHNPAKTSLTEGATNRHGNGTTLYYTNDR